MPWDSFRFCFVVGVVSSFLWSLDFAPLSLVISLEHFVHLLVLKKMQNVARGTYMTLFSWPVCFVNC